MPNRRRFIQGSLGAGAALSFGLPQFRSAYAQDSIAEVERNKAVVRRFKESMGTPEQEQIFGEILAPSYKRWRSGFQNLATNAAGTDLAEMADPVRSAIPDWSETIEILFGEGDMVVLRFRVQGTHMGNLFGIPATGKTVDFHEVGIFRLAEGKITDDWFMAEEAGLLQQLGAAMPERSDGKRIVPPVTVPTRPGQEVLEELLANPMDTQSYRNNLKVAAYKSENPPAGILSERPPGTRPYEVYTRRGFEYFSRVGEQRPDLQDQGLGNAFPDRVDQIAHLFGEGDQVLILFTLSATNTGSLYGIPPTNQRVDAWEVGIMGFEGDAWKTGWWFGDDLGMLLKLGGPQEFLFS